MPLCRDIYEFLVSPLSKFTRPCWASSFDNMLDAIRFHWVQSDRVHRPKKFECNAVEGVSVFVNAPTCRLPFTCNCVVCFSRVINIFVNDRSAAIFTIVSRPRGNWGNDGFHVIVTIASSL